jgi:site-specific DNA recombinase
MTKRAVLYARVSGDDRHREDRNLIGQLDMCREYAQEHGYEIVDELAEDDRGASGAVFDLPQLTKVRGMARTGAFDVLVVRELDRLSRSLEKQLLVEDELKRSGVAIEYVLGEYPDTSEGDLHKHVRAAVAEYERLVIKERVARARQLKIKAGNVLNRGSAPYGYSVVEREGKYELVVSEEEARIVRLIFEWYTVGDGSGEPLSTYAIQKKLDAMQVPTCVDSRQTRYPKKRACGEWSRPVIRDILLNETYAGTWHYTGASELGETPAPRSARERIPMAVPPVISPETWEMAQARRAERSYLGLREVKHDCLLRHRVRCEQCGVAATVDLRTNDNGRKRFYYRCAAALGHKYRNYPRPCNAPPFRVDAVDALVWEWVRSLLVAPETLEHGHSTLLEERDRSMAPLQARLAAIDKELAAKRQEMERLLDAYLVGVLTQEELEARRDELERSLSDLERERNGLVRRLETPALAPEQLADLRQFAAQVADGLARSEDDFEFRRFVIETLDVSGRLTVEDGQKIVIAGCVLGEKRLSLSSIPPRRRRRGWGSAGTGVEELGPGR